MTLGTTKLLIFALSVVSSARAQCPAISVFTNYGATTSVTVSSGTRAQIVDPSLEAQDITITRCGDATISASATATVLEGASVLVSGAYTPSPVNTMHRATALFRGTHVVPTVSYAAITVAPTASVSIIDAGDVALTLHQSASASFSGSNVYVDASSAGAVATLTAGLSFVYAGGEGTDIDMTFEGRDPVADGLSYGAASMGAHLQLRGSSYWAYADTEAEITMYGTGAECYAGPTGSCTAAGASNTFYADAEGYAQVVTGTGHQLVVSASATGMVGGSQNTAVALSGGNLQITGTADADVQQGATATVLGSAGYVTLSSGATGTLYRGATVTAPAGALLRAVSPMTTIESVGEFSACTIYVARELVSAAGNGPDRRAIPMPTGRCNTGSRSCPNLRGVFRCVDTSSDIFNCGGCTLSSDGGVDCTQEYDSAVACVAGRCVAA